MRQVLPIIMLLLSLTAATGFAQESGVNDIHAVLINGGMNKLMNHERYWNDCAFLYRTLRQTYHIPKRNITLLMSDGGGPGDDMMIDDANGFVSSPNDLDGDGIRDVYLAANMRNLVSVLNNLSRILTTSDHLFVFLIDHGGRDDGSSFLWLWNSEQLYDNVLAALLSLFNVGSMNIVAGQCYAGGFIDNLQGNGRVVTTACRDDELSWKCPDKAYDEFLYHWTCAIAGHDEQGIAVDADADGDGHVSMAEAYDYARSHDRRDETPLYSSTPVDLGERWTFDGVMSTGIDVAKRLNDKGERMMDKRGGVYDLTGKVVMQSPEELPSMPAKRGGAAKVLVSRRWQATGGRAAVGKRIMIVNPKR